MTAAVVSGNIQVKPLSQTTSPDHHIQLGGLDVMDLVKQYGSPLYVIDEFTLRQNCRAYTQTLKSIYPNNQVTYAGKAGLTIGIANILADEAMGLDVVSGGELYTALKSKLNPEWVYFHGNNKSEKELRMAIEYSIKLIVDNSTELDRIIQLCDEIGMNARIMLRLKPEIDAHTHDYIKTGQFDSKFGIDKDEVIPIIKRIQKAPNLTFIGIHSHIGSQIFDIDPYQDLSRIMVDHMLEIKQKTGADIHELNLGGGLGIKYIDQDDPPSIQTLLTEQIKSFKEALSATDLKEPKLIFEPGRSIIGPAGVTIYTIGAVKPSGKKTYLFVDGGMADNIRPALYQADYTVEIANKSGQPNTEVYDVVGRFCESGDILSEETRLPKAEPGDILIAYSTGAYNYSMASNYNRFCRPAMIAVYKGQARELVRRETYEDLIANDLP